MLVAIISLLEFTKEIMFFHPKIVKNDEKKQKIYDKHFIPKMDLIS